MTGRTVPRLVLWLFMLAAPHSDRQSLLADLEEEAACRAARDGRASARRWCWRQLAGSFVPLARERLAARPRALRRTHMMMFWRHVPSDVALAVRRLVHSPGVAFTCVVTLALGIGGTTAMFTLIQQVLLEPLPVRDPGGLYRLGDDDNCCVASGLQGAHSLFSYDLYLHLRDRTPEFTQLAAFQALVGSLNVRLARADATTPMAGEMVSGNYFSTLGVDAFRGRVLVPSDDRPGAVPVAVVSYRAWERYFASDPSIVGQTVSMNGAATTIVGVTPPQFYGETLRPNPPSIWVAIAQEPLLQPGARLVATPASHWLYIVGRVRPGVRISTIAPKVTGLLRQWLTGQTELSTTDRARIQDQIIRVVPAATGVNVVRSGMAPPLLILLAISGAVLLAACANLANLLLARGLRRRGEFAVRTALGASRGRLMAESLIESAVLVIAGGAASIPVAYQAARAMLAMAFPGAADLPIDPSPSLRVLGFAASVSIVTVLSVGLVPALIGSRSDPIDALRGVGRIAGDRASRLRQMLVTVQVAMALMLVACGGLLTMSLYNLQRQDFGFQTEGRYVAHLSPPGGGADRRLETIYDALGERMNRIDGVASVAFSLYSPMEGNNWSTRLTADGAHALDRLPASWNRVGPGYFDTVGTRLVRGRALDARDTPASPAVAVINETLARQLFGDGDPIGRHFGFAERDGGGARPFEIVGVVGDAKYQDGRRPPYPTFFLPFLQDPPALPAALQRSWGRSNLAGSVIVHVSRPVPDLEAELRRAFADAGSGFTVIGVSSLEAQVAGNFNRERLLTALSAGFSGMALLLACLGLYGVTIQAVTARTREIGVRLAIGATPGAVVRTMLRDACVQVMVGFVIGAGGAIIAGRLLEQLLFGIHGRDPRIILFSGTVVGLCAIVSAAIPAGRAARIDPVHALRAD